jgi:hypothetical protein
VPDESQATAGPGIANIFVGHCKQLSQSVVAVITIWLFPACLPCIDSNGRHPSTPPHRHHIFVSLSFALVHDLILRCKLLLVRPVRFIIFVSMKVTITPHSNQMRYDYILSSISPSCSKLCRILQVPRRDIYRLRTTGCSPRPLGSVHTTLSCLENQY